MSGQVLGMANHDKTIRGLQRRFNRFSELQCEALETSDPQKKHDLIRLAVRQQVLIYKFVREALEAQAK